MCGFITNRFHSSFHVSFCFIIFFEESQMIYIKFSKTIYIYTYVCLRVFIYRLIQIWVHL
ncbi:hypothetical protein DFH28DRAFT_1037416 [Melampsora americana]|nr:hypothetical protein DFH28DRAFT_1037416 [Melampsora americana]